MIDDTKDVGSHKDQRRMSHIKALKDAGIGQSYADKTLAAHPEGAAIREWIVGNSGANLTRIRAGYGFDIRGSGPVTQDIFNLTARAYLALPMNVLVTPLVRLPRLMADNEVRLTSGALFIRDFETTHDCPLRPYEIAEIEAFLTEMIQDLRPVCVLRHTAQPRGWWSPSFEALLALNTGVWEIAS